MFISVLLALKASLSVFSYRFKTWGETSRHREKVVLRFKHGQGQNFLYPKALVPLLQSSTEPKHRTCAVVGNSASLLDHDFGAQIGVWHLFHQLIFVE